MHASRCLYLLIASLAAAGDRAPAAAPQPSPFLVKASIREIMDAEIDPAADTLWGSVGITLTLAGEEDRQPRTAQQWAAVRRSAVTLIEATNLLAMEGRRIAPAGARARPGESSPETRQKLLDANRAAYLGLVQSLREVSLEALDAIDAKDAARLLEAGGDIDQACEACHLLYWYPPGSAPVAAARR